MATQDQYNGKSGIFGFEVAGAGSDYFTIFKNGDFVIPKELQGKDKELSMERLQEVAFRLKRADMTTRYTCLRLPGLNSDGEPNRQISISWE